MPFFCCNQLTKPPSYTTTGHGDLAVGVGACGPERPREPHSHGGHLPLLQGHTPTRSPFAHKKKSLTHIFPLFTSAHTHA